MRLAASRILREHQHHLLRVMVTYMEFGLEIIYHGLSSISHFDLEFLSFTAFSSVFEALHAHKLPHVLGPVTFIAVRIHSSFWI